MKQPYSIRHRHVANKPYPKRKRGMSLNRLTGFTLIEVLIATTITLLMMAALAQGFKRMSDGMAVGRAKLALNDRLRSVGAIIRADLEGVTIRPTPPTGALRGTGYFEYYDGPVTDYSATTNNVDPTGDSAHTVIPTSRFGDVDDILMFTARSAGEPFKGKVPRAIIKARQNLDAGLGVSTGISTVDWLTYDVISSEYAEIIYFALPVMAIDGAGNLVNAATNIPNAVITKNAGFPDEYRLFRRVLLIRPDLNIPLNTITATAPSISLTSGMPVEPQGLFYIDPAAATLSPLVCAAGNPYLAMAAAHQVCDLSIRRLPDAGGGNANPVAANSLEDLARRENRFAHWVLPSTNIPLSTFGLTSSSSMPLLALTSPLPATASLNLPFPLPLYSGFLHPAFALSGIRTGEDMLMSSTVGFDVRGYDPSVPLYYVTGYDGVSGVVGGDTSLGATGSDDLVVSPNDPGYPYGIQAGTLAGRGDFVDLAWGPRVFARSNQIGLAAPASATLFSQLSGYDGSGATFTNALYKSGLVVNNASGVPIIYQPTYDSWTERYEIDGFLQSEQSAAIRGTLWRDGLRDLGYVTSTDTVNTALVDLGTNGLDDGGSTGIVDDELEKQTSAPFHFAIPAIQVLLRTEDAGANVIQQTSITQDFISQ